MGKMSAGNQNAPMAQDVTDLMNYFAKVGIEGSNPFARSKI
jgi:hypothetical protein